MCKMISGRNVMIAGDSLQEELFYTFLSAMFHRVISPNNYTTALITRKQWENRNKCDMECENSYCNQPFDIDCGSDDPSFKTFFRRSDYLDNFEWINDIKLFNISLIILNVGAHFKEDNILLSNINNSIHKIYQANENIDIIWRNSNIGHPNCFQVCTLLIIYFCYC